MAFKIDPAKYNREEKDNFVRIVLSEREIEAAVRILQARHRRQPEVDEALEFCFKIAMRKVVPRHLMKPEGDGGGEGRG